MTKQCRFGSGKNLLGILAILVCSAPSLSFLPWTLPLLLPFGGWLIYFFWCLATDKRWHLIVTDGHIEWDPLLGKRRSLALADVESLELNLDDKREIYATLKSSGKKQRLSILSRHDPESFLNAVVAECPAITVDGAHLGSW